MIHTRRLKQILDNAPICEERKERIWIPQDLKEGMRIRDKHRCVVCERKKNLKLHHIDPYGLSVPDNLVTVCEICHEYIHKILKRKGYPYISPLLAMKIHQRGFY